MRELPRNRKEPTKPSTAEKAVYVPPTVEFYSADESVLSEKESSSDIILQALQAYRANIENIMAKKEEEFALFMKEQMQRLERVDEIIGGMA